MSAVLLMRLGAHLIPVMLAVMITSCHYRTQIQAIDQRAQMVAEVDRANAAEQLARQIKITQQAEAQHYAAQKELADRYAGAVDRLRQQAASRAGLSAPSGSTPSTDEAARGGGLSERGGAADHVPLNVVGLADLLYQCDTNTQQLVGLQGWVKAQLAGGYQAQVVIDAPARSGEVLRGEAVGIVWGLGLADGVDHQRGGGVHAKYEQNHRQREPHGEDHEGGGDDALSQRPDHGAPPA